MKGLLVVLAGLANLSLVTATTDQCTKDNSAGCCAGFTYLSAGLQTRKRDLLCSAGNMEGAPTCPTTADGKTRPPVCTDTKQIADGHASMPFSCGILSWGSAQGSLTVDVDKCTDKAGDCFFVKANPPHGILGLGSTFFNNDFKISISKTKDSSLLARSYVLKLAAAPVQILTSDILGSGAPCTGNGCSVWITLQGGSLLNTCSIVGGVIPGLLGKPNQFQFTLTSKTVCNNWCCCPPPPAEPQCDDGDVECTGKCPSSNGLTCTTKVAVDLWNIGNFYNKCCCKPQDAPTCPTDNPIEQPLQSCPSYCRLVQGSFANCAGDRQFKCCCPSQVVAPQCPATFDERSLDTCPSTCRKVVNSAGDAKCCCPPQDTPTCPSGKGLEMSLDGCPATCTVVSGVFSNPQGEALKKCCCPGGSSSSTQSSTSTQPPASYTQPPSSTQSQSSTQPSYSQPSTQPQCPLPNCPAEKPWDRAFTAFTGCPSWCKLVDGPSTNCVGGKRQRCCCAW